MKLNYFDHEGNLLGACEYSSFIEILIPSFSGKYEYYLKLKFDGRSNLNWRLVSIDHTDPLDIKLILEAVADYKSLDAFANSQSKSPQHFVRDFSIVDVEFGFIEQVFDGTATNNMNYTNALLSGEIHKRRPCILLSFGATTAQIIPLTSKQKTPTKYDVPLDLSKVSGLSHKYHVPTFALLDLMQPVSYKRIYGPLLSTGKNSFTKSQALPAGDRDIIRSTLSELYGDLNKQRTLEKANQALSDERFKLIKKLKDSRALQLKNAELLIELGSTVGDGGTLEEIEESILKRRVT